MVSGNYQSGIAVIDFSDPTNAKEIAFADPPPLVDPDPPVGIEGGGDWSSYWYDGRIYESDMTRGPHHLAPRRPGGGHYLRTGHLTTRRRSSSRSTGKASLSREARTGGRRKAVSLVS